MASQTKRKQRSPDGARFHKGYFCLDQARVEYHALQDNGWTKVRFYLLPALTDPAHHIGTLDLEGVVWLESNPIFSDAFRDGVFMRFLEHCARDWVQR